MTTTTALSHQISAYKEMKDVLETDYFGKWVVFHNGELAGSYESFEKAAEDAVDRFGRGPYLIRRVGGRATETASFRSIQTHQCQPLRLAFPDGGGVLGRDALSWYGPTIHVQMGFDASYRLVSPHSPNLSSQLLPALVDTGAVVSCIDSDLALQLRLPLIDQQQVAGSSRVTSSQCISRPDLHTVTKLDNLWRIFWRSSSKWRTTPLRSDRQDFPT